MKGWKKNERNWSLVPLYKPPYLIENQNWRLHLKYLASCLSSNRNFNNVQKRRIALHGPQFFLTFKLCHVLPRHFCYVNVLYTDIYAWTNFIWDVTLQSRASLENWCNFSLQPRCMCRRFYNKLSTKVYEIKNHSLWQTLYFRIFPVFFDVFPSIKILRI